MTSRRRRRHANRPGPSFIEYATSRVNPAQRSGDGSRPSGHATSSARGLSPRDQRLACPCSSSPSWRPSRDATARILDATAGSSRLLGSARGGSGVLPVRGIQGDGNEPDEGHLAFHEIATGAYVPDQRIRMSDPVQSSCPGCGIRDGRWAVRVATSSLRARLASRTTECRVSRSPQCAREESDRRASCVEAGHPIHAAGRWIPRATRRSSASP
jgi:hypothetical protein